MATIEELLERQAAAAERAATALEALVELAQNPITTTVVNNIQATDKQVELERAAAAKTVDGNPKDKSTKPAQAPEPEKPAPEPEVDPLDEAPTKPAKKLTQDDIRARLKDYRAANGAPAMMDILARVGGVSSLAELPADKYDAVYEAAAV